MDSLPAEPQGKPKSSVRTIVKKKKEICEAIASAIPAAVKILHFYEIVFNFLRNSSIHVDAYVENLEKQYWWTYLQGRNRDTDVENSLVDTVKDVEGGMNWDSNIEICILPYLRQITSGKLLYNTGRSAWCSGTT